MILPYMASVFSHPIRRDLVDPGVCFPYNDRMDWTILYFGPLYTFPERAIALIRGL